MTGEYPKKGFKLASEYPKIGLKEILVELLFWIFFIFEINELTNTNCSFESVDTLAPKLDIKAYLLLDSLLFVICSWLLLFTSINKIKSK